MRCMSRQHNLLSVGPVQVWNWQYVVKPCYNKVTCGKRAELGSLQLRVQLPYEDTKMYQEFCSTCELEVKPWATLCTICHNVKSQIREFRGQKVKRYMEVKFITNVETMNSRRVHKCTIKGQADFLWLLEKVSLTFCNPDVIEYLEAFISY